MSAELLKEKVLRKSCDFLEKGFTRRYARVARKNVPSTYTNGQEVGKTPHQDENIFVGEQGSVDEPLDAACVGPSTISLRSRRVDLHLSTRIRCLSTACSSSQSYGASLRTHAPRTTRLVWAVATPCTTFGRQNRTKPGVATAQTGIFVRGLFSASKSAKCFPAKRWSG